MCHVPRRMHTRECISGAAGQNPWPSASSKNTQCMPPPLQRLGRSACTAAHAPGSVQPPEPLPEGMPTIDALPFPAKKDSAEGMIKRGPQGGWRRCARCTRLHGR